MTDYDVVVVGAGPVGLALAGDLGWRGARCLLVDRGEGAIYQPKMDLVGIRTMEFCRRWGIVRWVEESPYPRDYPQDNLYVTAVTGWELGREPAPAMGSAQPPPQSPQKRERCPQDMFDPILRRFVAAQPSITTMLQTEYVGFSTTVDGVRVQLRGVASGKQVLEQARFLVGCDGAASTVRDQLGIGMRGRDALTYTTNVIFRSASLPDLHDKGLAYRFIVVDQSGTWATIVAINGRDRWRMSIIGDGQPRTYSHDEICKAIRHAVGVDFAFEIETVVPWIRRELVAETYGTASVFIAGDAAHVMSPTGGFGMNTGIGDAVDLSWKLDAILAGWGGPGLLASYDAERRPVGDRNVAEASANLARMLSPRNDLTPPPEFLQPNAAGAAARERFGSEFAERMKHEWHTIGVHLGYRYDDSPIVVPDGTPTPPEERMTYTQINRPGARAPHAWIEPGVSTLDVFGTGFALLRTGQDAPTGDAVEKAASGCGLPLAVTTLSEEPVVAAYGAGLTLVRPDGHVAWRSTAEPGPEEAEHVIDVVRGAGPGPVTEESR